MDDTDARLKTMMKSADRIAERMTQYDGLSERANALARILVTESEMLYGDKRQRRETDGWRYGTYQDLILEIGGMPQVASLELPNWVDKAPLQQCYQNAYELVVACPELTYVEGYALGSFFPVAHAWTVDEDGRIIDPTWASLDDIDEAAYVGVKFSTEFMVRHILNRQWWSVFESDWTNQNGLLKYGLVLGDDDEVIDIGEA